MSKNLYGVSPTSLIIRCKLMDSTVSTGAGKTGLVYNSTGLIISTIKINESSPVVYSTAGGTIQTIATLGTYAAPSANNCRFKEVDATNNPGVYEIQLLDARAASTDSLLISISGVTGLAQADFEIECKNIAANVIQIGGTAQTARDIGASVLLSSGTGPGQLDFTSGVVKSNLVQILATALTETAGYLAAGFKKFFNVASPVHTVGSVDQTGDSYAIVNNGTNGNAAIKTAVAAIPTTPLLAANYTAPDNASITAIKAKTDSLTFTLANKVACDLRAIEGQLTSGNNATLNLKQLKVVNGSGGHAIHAEADSLHDGIYCQGDSGLHAIAVGNAGGNGGIKAETTSGFGKDILAPTIQTIEAQVDKMIFSEDGNIQADLKEIDEQATNGNNAILHLKQLDIINPTFGESAINASSSGPAIAAISATSHGIMAKGGITAGANGVFAWGPSGNAIACTSNNSYKDISAKELDGIKAKTDTLPTNPADNDEILAAIATAISDIAGVQGGVSTVISVLPLSGKISNFDVTGNTIDGVPYSTIFELQMAIVNGRFKKDYPHSGDITFYKRNNTDVLFSVHVTSDERTRI